MGMIAYHYRWKVWIWEQMDSVCMSLEEKGCMMEVINFAKNLEIQK